MKLKAAAPYIFVPLLIVTLILLRVEGRDWWCACGNRNLWDGDIWSAHCSQHLFDPYSFTHVLHGLLFYVAGLILVPRVPFVWRLLMATFIECLWEVIENSEFIIHRYREVTISLGYEGDSVINSLGDIGCCIFGFFLAHYLGLRRSLLVFAATELLLLLTIRDNLTLNVLMLVCPVDAVKAWQMIH